MLFLLLIVILFGHKKMDMPTTKYVRQQPSIDSWVHCGGPEPKVAIGIGGPVQMLQKVVTWRFFSEQ